MKSAQLFTIICLTASVLVWPAVAKDKPGKGNSARKTTAGSTAPEAPQPSQVVPGAKEPWLTARVAISNHERYVINSYVNQYRPEERSLTRKSLPPGLAKKAARGRQLPPGWERKCVPGQVMPPDVVERAHPLPPDLVVKLPPPPPNTVTITVGGKVVRLLEATHEILDVFDVHLGF